MAEICYNTPAGEIEVFKREVCLTHVTYMYMYMYIQCTNCNSSATLSMCAGVLHYSASCKSDVHVDKGICMSHLLYLSCPNSVGTIQ